MAAGRQLVGGDLLWIQLQRADRVIGKPLEPAKQTTLGQAVLMQLRDLLNSYREAAKSELYGGDYFGRVVRVFLDSRK